MVIFEERIGPDPETARKARANRQGNRYSFTYTNTTDTYVFTVTKQEAPTVITNLQNLLATIAPTSHIVLIDGADEFALPQNFIELYLGFYQRFVA